MIALRCATAFELSQTVTMGEGELSLKPHSQTHAALTTSQEDAAKVLYSTLRMRYRKRVLLLLQHLEPDVVFPVHENKSDTDNLLLCD